MANSEKESFETFRALTAEPQVAGYAGDHRMAFVFDGAARHLLWCNAVAAHYCGLGVLPPPAEADLGRGEALRHALMRHMAARFLLPSGLVRLRVFVDYRPVAFMCRLQAVPLAGGQPALSVLVVDPVPAAATDDEPLAAFAALLAGPRGGALLADAAGDVHVLCGAPEGLQFSGPDGFDGPAAARAGVKTLPLGEAGERLLLLPAGAGESGDAAPPPPRPFVPESVRKPVLPATAERPAEGSAAGAVPVLPPPVQAGSAAPASARVLRFSWQSDARHVVTFVSADLARAVGVSSAAIIGHDWRQIAARFGFGSGALLREQLAEGCTWSGVEVWWPRDGDGAFVPVALSALAVRDGAGVFRGLRGFGQCRPAEARASGAPRPAPAPVVAEPAPPAFAPVWPPAGTTRRLPPRETDFDAAIWQEEHARHEAPPAPAASPRLWAGDVTRQNEGIFPEAARVLAGWHQASLSTRPPPPAVPASPDYSQREKRPSWMRGEQGRDALAVAENPLPPSDTGAEGDRPSPPPAARAGTVLSLAQQPPVDRREQRPDWMKAEEVVAPQEPEPVAEPEPEPLPAVPDWYAQRPVWMQGGDEHDALVEDFSAIEPAAGPPPVDPAPFGSDRQPAPQDAADWYDRRPEWMQGGDEPDFPVEDFAAEAPAVDEAPVVSQSAAPDWYDQRPAWMLGNEGTGTLAEPLSVAISAAPVPSPNEEPAAPQPAADWYDRRPAWMQGGDEREALAEDFFAGEPAAEAASANAPLVGEDEPAPLTVPADWRGQPSGGQEELSASAADQERVLPPVADWYNQRPGWLQASERRDEPAAAVPLPGGNDEPVVPQFVTADGYEHRPSWVLNDERAPVSPADNTTTPIDEEQAAPSAATAADWYGQSPVWKAEAGVSVPQHELRASPVAGQDAVAVSAPGDATGTTGPGIVGDREWGAGPVLSSASKDAETASPPSEALLPAAMADVVRAGEVEDLPAPIAGAGGAARGAEADRGEQGAADTAKQVPDISEPVSAPAPLPALAPPVEEGGAATVDAASPAPALSGEAAAADLPGGAVAESAPAPTPPIISSAPSASAAPEPLAADGEQPDPRPFWMRAGAVEEPSSPVNRAAEIVSAGQKTTAGTDAGEEKGPVAAAASFPSVQASPPVSPQAAPAAGTASGKPLPHAATKADETSADEAFTAQRPEWTRAEPVEVPEAVPPDLFGPDDPLPGLPGGEPVALPGWMRSGDDTPVLPSRETPDESKAQDDAAAAPAGSADAGAPDSGPVGLGRAVLEAAPGAAALALSRGGEEGVAPEEDIGRLSRPEWEAFRLIAAALGARFEGDDQPLPNTPAGVEERGATPPSSRPTVSTAEGEGPETRILDRLPIGLLVCRNNQVLYLNVAALRLVGQPDLASFEAAGGLASLFVDEPGGAGVRMLKVRRADGSAVAVEARMHAVPWGSARALLMVLQPREAATDGAVMAPDAVVPQPAPTPPAATPDEAALVLDALPDAVVVVDGARAIVTVNRAAERLFGRPRSQLRGHPVSDVVTSVGRGALDEAVARITGPAGSDPAVVHDIEAVAVSGAGDEVPLMVGFGHFGAGEAARVCLTLRDVGAWKRSEAALVAAARGAEAASAQKSEVLARITHEIRTPLNAIIGFAEVMLEERLGPVGTARYRDYLRDIRLSGGHILSLVNDLLDLARIEAGQADLSPEPVALNAIVRECVGMMQPEAGNERVIMRTSLAASLPLIFADRRSVRQIVLNVLSNAIRFNTVGGQVILSTSLEAGGRVVFCCRDTGIGMSGEEISLAMQPFRRLGGARRGGTGLGLPLTRALAEANGATFSIRSEPGHGTLVEVQFSTAAAAGQTAGS